MSRTRISLRPFIFLAVPVLVAVGLSVAKADAPLRAYVAARTGKDKNPCTLKSPCQSIARAVAAIESASGVSTVTITEDGDYGWFSITDVHHPVFITIEAAPGVVANVHGDHDHPAVNIAAGGQDGVVLRRLHFDTPTGNVGVACSGARVLYVESCTLHNFNFGIDFSAAGRLFVTDTIFKRVTTGIRVKSGADPSFASITHCRIEDGTTGLDVEDRADVTLRDSVIAANVSYGAVCRSGVLGKTANLFIENSSINGGAYCVAGCDEGVGIMTTATEGTAQVWLSNSTVTQNIIGVEVAAGGTVFTFKNNRIAGNKTDVKGALTDHFPQ